MSQKDLESAITRLKQANQDIHWGLSVLSDPSSHLKDYDLTQEETEALLQEFHGLLAEAHVAQAHVLLKKVNVQVENKEVQVVGPVPPWLKQTEMNKSPKTFVGDVEPWSKSTSTETPFSGDVEPWNAP